MLGIDFWCNFCEIEKSELKQLMSSSMWPESRGELARRFIEEKCEQIREKELSWLQKKAQLFVDARKFFQGRLQPVRPPRRVIRPEEKFRSGLISIGS